MSRPSDMTERLQREDSAVAHPPRRWVRRAPIVLIQVLALAGGGVFLAKLVTSDPVEQDCATATRSRVPDGIKVSICQREYEHTRQPVTGALLANALRRSGNATAATALANDLLHTEARGDALYVLGKIAVAQNRLEDAMVALQAASKLHRMQNRHGHVATDDLALAEVHTRRHQFAEALQSLDDCLSEVRIGADRLTEGTCHLAAARVLTRVGYFRAADRELDRAKPFIEADYDLAALWLEQGNLHQEAVRDSLRRSQDARAVEAFRTALELAQRAKNTAVARSAHLNLAYSLAEVQRTEEAEHHLAEAGLLDLDKAEENNRAQIAAQIAFHRSNYGLAYSVNERVYAKLNEDSDERIDVSVMQARIALRSKDLSSAERWARRGVETAERIRSQQKVAELRPWVLASRREPYEVLFAVLARSGQIEKAIEVFDQWQGRTMLDTMARPGSEDVSLSSLASRVQGLGLWLPSASNAPLMKLDGRGVLETLRKIDLIALAVAEGYVWRLTASHGRIRIDPLPPFESLRDQLDRFRGTPTNRKLGDELGALFLPEDLVRDTRVPLYVVLDAPLAALPFAALRRNERPLIAARPLIWTPRLPTAAASCDTRPAMDGAVVLADVTGDLPDARRESSKVASLFNATPFVGAAATSTALFAAKPDSLLHVAVHADVKGIGFLKLHDRTVSAPEISANKLGPALVVLSACSTSQSDDPELAGSLSTAFLTGGSTSVLATLRPVTDKGALELTRRFYAAEGVRDPVHALAEVQAQLAGGNNEDWPNFAVFSANACVL